MLTAVMYHYIRPTRQSAFPRLKALDVQDFIGQISWLKAHHQMITPADLRAAVQSGEPLPDKACLLTFDDGYSDHYEHVAPILDDFGISATFFAPQSSLIQRRMLEVNKIQLILAAMEQPELLSDELDRILAAEGSADISALRAAHFQPNRYDAAPVAYAKRLLQHALPAALRSHAINLLFARFVTADEAGLADSFYLTTAQAGDMTAAGHEFGGHGDLHLWHGEATATDLAAEVAGSVKALSAVSAPSRGGFYCYPFGSQNEAVRQAVAAAGFSIGFTVEPRVADLRRDDPLALPRLDTNDLPKAWP